MRNFRSLSSGTVQNDIFRYMTCPFYPFYCSCINSHSKQAHCPVQNCESCANDKEQMVCPENEQILYSYQNECPYSDLPRNTNIGRVSVTSIEYYLTLEKMTQKTKTEVQCAHDSVLSRNEEFQNEWENYPHTLIEINKNDMKVNKKEKLSNIPNKNTNKYIMSKNEIKPSGDTEEDYQTLAKCNCSLINNNQPWETSEYVNDCAISYPSCSLFPKGRCPMENLGLCDCDFPVPPCLAKPQCGWVKPSPPQFCFKEDCCMGLPQPPLKVASQEKFGDRAWYRLLETKPGQQETKYYIEISPRSPDFPEKRRWRLNPYWEVVKGGEGYLRCKTVKNILEKKAECSNRTVQYDPNVFIIDPSTREALNRKKNEEVTLQKLFFKLKNN